MPLQNHISHTFRLKNLQKIHESTQKGKLHIDNPTISMINQTSASEEATGSLIFLVYLLVLICSLMHTAMGLKSMFVNLRIPKIQCMKQNNDDALLLMSYANQG